MLNEAVTPKSEQETSHLMYQAMADSMNVSAEDIEHGIEDSSSQPPPAPNENDEETLTAMEEYQKEYLQPNPIYAVRGALLYCSEGSHCRRLNLPKSHGVYILDHAAMHAGDNVGGEEGADLNVTTFGICNVRDGGGSITLEKEAPRNNQTGLFTGDTATGTIDGAPCLPMITQQWQDTHTDTKVGTEKLPALTTLSFLMCTHGGIIQVWRSGQEDAD